MKVIHIIWRAHLGGAERVAMALVRDARARGHAAALVALTGSAEAGHLGADAVLVEDGSGGAGARVLASLALRGYIARAEPDLVFAHAPQVALAWARCPRSPALWVVHGYDTCWDGRGRRPALSRWLQRRAAPAFSLGLAAPSRALAVSAAHALRLPPERVRVVANSVDTGAVPFVARAPGAAPVIAVLARLVPVKGHRHALAAFAELRRSVPTARLIFIGEGPSRGGLEAQAESLGLGAAVEFLGTVPDPGPWLRSAHALWVTSEREGFGLACIEAMASGLPVLGFNAPGIGEVLDDKSGVLVPAGDTAGLARATLSLWRDAGRYDSVARRARERAVAEFGAERMLAAYRAIEGGLSVATA